mgnify:FL=1
MKNINDSTKVISKLLEEEKNRQKTFKKILEAIGSVSDEDLDFYDAEDIYSTLSSRSEESNFRTIDDGIEDDEDYEIYDFSLEDDEMLDKDAIGDQEWVDDEDEDFDEDEEENWGEDEEDDDEEDDWLYDEDEVL